MQATAGVNLSQKVTVCSSRSDVGKGRRRGKRPSLLRAVRKTAQRHKGAGTATASVRISYTTDACPIADVLPWQVSKSHYLRGSSVLGACR